MNSLKESLKKALLLSPPEVISTKEVETVIESLLRWPVEDKHIEVLRTEHISIGDSLVSARYIVKRNLKGLTTELEKVKTAVLTESQNGAKYKLTKEDKDSLTRTDPRTEPLCSLVEDGEIVLDLINEYLDIYSERGRMIFEKSVESRKELQN